MNKNRILAGIGLATALALPLSACSSGSGSGGSSKSSGAASSSAAAKPTKAPAGNNAGKPFGAACSKIPTDPANPGSGASMAKAPVATAASNNKMLTTLVSLVKKEKLTGTLNGAKALTVFAPVNTAFGKIPKSTMNKLTDKQIASILKLHVIGQRIAPSNLAGQHPTLNGGNVKVSGSGDSFTVAGAGNKTPAHVVCGNVQTANATVYLVDSVLMPAM